MIKVIDKKLDANYHELKRLVKKRNEEELSKPLERTKCAEIIMSILKKEHPSLAVKEDTILKLLQRWDKRINEGKRDLVSEYRTARNSTEDIFAIWVINYWVDYYINHRNIRKSKKPFDTKTLKKNSSEVAQNEAAVQKHRKEE
ncbi:MAG: hypothetical protein PUC15_07310 [Lentisphaeria bacterium]|nr:hypothetical protein [Lentisphaeria bacterium]